MKKFFGVDLLIRVSFRTFIRLSIVPCALCLVPFFI